MKRVLTGVMAITALLLSGCGTWAMQSQSKMTKSVFLKELNPKKTIMMVNTGLPGELAALTLKKLREKGYEIVESQDAATYVLRVSVLNKDGQQDQNGAEAAGTMGAASGLVAYSATGSGSNSLGVGLAGAAIGGVFAWATADGTFRMQVDVLIQENTGKEELLHQTRVVAQAKQVHLDVEDAVPVLEEKISSQIAGIFI